MQNPQFQNLLTFIFSFERKTQHIGGEGRTQGNVGGGEYWCFGNVNLLFSSFLFWGWIQGNRLSIFWVPLRILQWPLNPLSKSAYSYSEIFYSKPNKISSTNVTYIEKRVWPGRVKSKHCRITKEDCEKHRIWAIELLLL